MSAESEMNEGKDDSLPENAFLIIEGTKAIPLNQSTITIGRHQDNMVVIDDPRVSRHHMELRVIQGRVEQLRADRQPVVRAFKRSWPARAQGGDQQRQNNRDSLHRLMSPVV